MAGGKKRKGAKAAQSNKKKQRQDEKTADEEKQVELPVVPQPAIARLYRDALQSVFTFCGLKDLSCVMSVSRKWNQSVRAMPPICARIDRFNSPYRVFAASGLAPHVGSLKDTDSEYLHTNAINNNDLLIVTQRMPALTSLELTAKLLMPPSAPLVFAPKLKTLKLRLQGSETAVASIQATIVTISQLPALTRLTLGLPSCFPALSFAPLSSAGRLKHLTLFSFVVEHFTPFSFDEHAQPTETQIDQVRALSHLSTMAIENLSHTLLTRLLRKPHALEWTQIHQLNHLDAAASATLASLPSLTTLDTINTHDLSFFRHLPNLESLALHVGTGPLTADAMVNGFPRRSQLTSLHLSAPVTTAQLRRLLRRLPELTDLTLDGCDSLRGLRCFEDCDSIQDSLESLMIRECNKLRPRELKHVLALYNLTSLTLQFSFNGALDDGLLAMLTPPTRAFPSLQKLVHEYYEDDDGPYFYI